MAFIAIFGLTALQQTTAGSVVNLLDEGAKGDGGTDDQNAITNALAKAKSLGLPLYAPGGHTYVHSNYISIDSVALYGDGDATVFSASNVNNGAMRLTGTNPSLKSVKVLYNPTPTTRLTSGTQSGVFMDHAAGFTVDNVTVGNSPCIGILVFVSHGTATNYATVTNCRVANTLADSYHCTGASSFVKLTGNTTTNSGDDMFAVVSY
ncbi:MAG TPA: glycosyl hydrolase family 28-related protein, partial [Terriglobales bacterium]|nr:glycosyl hydrolase family 28-related protein [Terriglobales bacterium]